MCQVQTRLPAAVATAMQWPSLKWVLSVCLGVWLHFSLTSYTCQKLCTWRWRFQNISDWYCFTRTSLSTTGFRKLLEEQVCAGGDPGDRAAECLSLDWRWGPRPSGFFDCWLFTVHGKPGLRKEKRTRTSSYWAENSFDLGEHLCVSDFCKSLCQATGIQENGYNF